jgi:hypothetical protein
MENKIYIVTSGEYSDYHIDAVFSTKELAEDYIQQNGIDYEIEEYNLDEEIDRNTKLWRVKFDIKDGKLKDANVMDYEEDDFRDTCKVLDYFRSQHISFFVDADTMNKAVKIASERLAAVKANEYIWLRLTRPYDMQYGINRYETFNIKTNEFTKQ